MRCTWEYLQCRCRLLRGRTWSPVGTDAYQRDFGRERRRLVARYTGRACRRPRSSSSRCCSRRRCSGRVACDRTTLTSWERRSQDDSWRWTTREDRSLRVTPLWHKTTTRPLLITGIATVNYRQWQYFPAFSWVLSLWPAGWLAVGKSCRVSVRAINRSASGFPNALVFCCVRAGPSWKLLPFCLCFCLSVCLSVSV